MERRHRNWLRYVLVRGEGGRAAKRERQELSGRDLSFAGSSIAQHLGSAPSGEYRKVLRAVDLICNRWRHDSDSCVEFPQQLAIGGTISLQLSVGSSLKNEVAGG